MVCLTAFVTMIKADNVCDLMMWNIVSPEKSPATTQDVTIAVRNNGETLPGFIAEVYVNGQLAFSEIVEKEIKNYDEVGENDTITLNTPVTVPYGTEFGITVGIMPIRVIPIATRQTTS